MSDKAAVKVVKNKPDAKVVRMLESLVDDAKKGKILEFVLVGRYEKGQVLNCYAGKTNEVYTMAGLLFSAAIDYKTRNIEDA